jgi:hypothetical protein
LAAEFRFQPGDEFATATPVRVRVDKCNTGTSPLAIAGQVFAKGLGTHAPSTTYVRLDGRARRLTAKVGIDDSASAPGSAEFLVFGDSSLLWRSGIVLAGSSSIPVSVPLDGVKLLQLVVTAGTDTNAKDFSNWADVAISYEGAAPAPVSRSALGTEPVRVALATLPFERFDNRPGKFAVAVSLKEPVPFSLDGVSVPAAVVLHSGHRVVIGTGGRATRFQARLGVQDNASSSGSVRFQFIGNGRTLLDTGVIRAGHASEDVDLTLEGIDEFIIAVDDAGDGELFDHALIADAVFTVRDASPVFKAVQKR